MFLMLYNASEFSMFAAGAVYQVAIPHAGTRPIVCRKGGAPEGSLREGLTVYVQPLPCKFVEPHIAVYPAVL